MFAKADLDDDGFVTADDFYNIMTHRVYWDSWCRLLLYLILIKYVRSCFRLYYIGAIQCVVSNKKPYWWSFKEIVIQSIENLYKKLWLGCINRRVIHWILWLPSLINLLFKMVIIRKIFSMHCKYYLWRVKIWVVMMSCWMIQGKDVFIQFHPMKEMLIVVNVKICRVLLEAKKGFVLIYSWRQTQKQSSLF